MKPIGLIATSVALALAAAETDPLVLKPERPVGICLRRDGSFAFYICDDPQSPPELQTIDGKLSMSLRPVLELPGRGEMPLPTRLIADDTGELHAITMRRRGDGTRPAVGRFIDLWHQQTRRNRTTWNQATCVWRGYTGAVMMRTRLRSGRLLVPFGIWIPNRPVAPPTGCHVSTVIFSDDNGQSWQLSDAALTSPCVANYNGNNYGACEPVVTELTRPNHLYMLMRTQAGFLYQSRSANGGTTWSDAKPSRFHTSTGPPGIVRLPDGRIVLVWNNCAMPPRINGQGVYGGRDALHAAISTDDGESWSGFREIYRDLNRNDTPPKRGDRGTAYPSVAFDAEGYLIVESGQGAGRRNFLRFHPSFLTETEAFDDFSSGLDAWHVFKPFGSASGYWRDRTTGATLRPHPDDPERQALWLRHADSYDPDGATWNFPLAWAGEMAIRVRLPSGSAGATVALGDRLFEPTDSNGEDLAIFLLKLTAAEQEDTQNTAHVTSDIWHNLRLKWDLDRRQCGVYLNDQFLRQLPRRHNTLNGICYLRLRSAAVKRDEAGVFIDMVHVKIHNNATPPAPEAARKAMQTVFFEEMSSRRNRTLAAPPPTQPERPDDPRLPAPQG